MPSCLCRTVIVISIMDKQNNKCNIWGINTIENLFIIGWFIGMTSSCSLLSIYSKHSILNIFSIMGFLYTTHSIPSFFIIIFSLYHTVFLYTTLYSSYHTACFSLYHTVCFSLYHTVFVIPHCLFFFIPHCFLLYHTVCFSLYHTVFLYITHNTLYLYNYVYFIHVPQFFFIRQTLYSKSSLFTLFS